MASDPVNEFIATHVLPVEGKQLGHFTSKSLDSWEVLESITTSFQTLKKAANLLKRSNIPVAFPTETVYGLGADATRSEAVRGIYKAKGRPSDNPLIIHICDLNMLRDLLAVKHTNGHTYEDPIPAIYKPLIDRFWPGPLTILLSEPKHSVLAPEVTAGLKTFGVRMPDSALALSLIKLAGVPVAAPSANASTKPSTTQAEHVLHDLDGRIELILDGGPCEVGVESTIVDGLCEPPVVLRPGGISINSLRECKGWEDVRIAYKDKAEVGAAPRAPGMKYKHYSPKAKIILAESGANIVPQDMMNFRLELGTANEGTLQELQGLKQDMCFKLPAIGIVRTRYWPPWGAFNESSWAHVVPQPTPSKSTSPSISTTTSVPRPSSYPKEGSLYANTDDNQPPLLAKVIEISLGTNTKAIAHSLFSALRELDKRDVDVIYVEGIEDVRDNDNYHDVSKRGLKVGNGTGAGEEGGDIAAAVMNRLRKAASIIIRS